MGKFRVLPDQLSGLAQRCNGLFFVGSGIKSNCYNLIESIPIFSHHMISELFQVFTFNITLPTLSQIIQHL